MAQAAEAPRRPARPRKALKAMLDIVGPPGAVIGALGVLGLVFFGWKNANDIPTILPYYIVVLFLALRYAPRGGGKGQMEVRINPPQGAA